MTESKLVKEFNKLRKQALSQPKINAKEYLTSLSDYELKVFICGKTMRFGRDFQSSWKNACLHLKDREKAIKLFASQSIN
jgi:hypothetical protein